MKNLKALIIIALVFSIVLISACATGTTETDTGSDSSDYSTDSSGPIKYEAEIPDGVDPTGYKFRVLVNDPSTIVWYDVDFSADDASLDIVDEATYRRLVEVEEALDVEIITMYDTPPIYNTIIESAGADSDDFDVVFTPIVLANQLAQSNYLEDLTDYGYLDLNSPWWDRNCVEDLSIGGRTYTAAGDISYNYLRSINVIFFAKDMITDYKLPNPYEYMENGTWTIETMLEMAKKVTSDTSGDGRIISTDDTFGFAYNTDTMMQFFFGADVRSVQKDNTDYPELIFMSDSRTSEVYLKLCDYLYDRSFTFNWEVDSGGGGAVDTAFRANRLLFFPTSMFQTDYLRAMDAPLGILPFPKYEESQDGYHHAVTAGVAFTMVVPRISRDSDIPSVIIEALGAEGKNYITPAYIEKSLLSKFARDDESEATLKIVFSSISYDMGFTYDIGGMRGMINTLVLRRSTDIASTYNGRRNQIHTELQKMIDIYWAEQ